VRGYSPFPALFSSRQLSCPDQSVKIVEPNSQLLCCFNCRNFVSFSVHKNLLDSHTVATYAGDVQRHTYNTVTAPNTVTVPILIEAPASWAEGKAYVDDDRIKVREFTEDDADLAQKPGKENWEHLTTAQREEILLVVNIIRALDSNDLLAAKNSMLELRKKSGSQMAVQLAARLIEDPDYIPDSLVYQLCKELEGVRLILWKKDKDRKLAPGLYSPTLRSAFWIHALMSGIGTGKGFRICPKCSKIFWQDRPDQNYCSVKCREAHRIERWRANKKTEASQVQQKAAKKSTTRNKARRKR
jgi:hypothetical protein